MYTAPALSFAVAVRGDPYPRQSQPQQPYLGTTEGGSSASTVCTTATSVSHGTVYYRFVSG